MHKALTQAIILIIFHATILAKDSEESFKTRQAITKTLSQFIQANRNKNFKRALQHTTGQQRKIYDAINQNMHMNQQKVPQHLRLYFNRLKDFKINRILWNDEKNKSLAIITFIFHYPSKNSQHITKKYRTTYYYLIKQKKHWKITFATLEREQIIHPPSQ